MGSIRSEPNDYRFQQTVKYPHMLLNCAWPSGRESNGLRLSREEFNWNVLISREWLCLFSLFVRTCLRRKVQKILLHSFQWIRHQHVSD